MAVSIPILIQADRILRGRPIAPNAKGTGRLRRVALLVIAFGLAYGAVMGTFSGLTPDRLLQVLYSAVKVPLLLFTTFALALPSFFVINTLCGLRDDFSEALRALVSAQAGLTIVLASFAPLTAFWYLSVGDYSVAILYNAVIFGVASVAGQWVLRKHYAVLIARNPVHRLLMWGWLVIYAFVGIQMGWVMRPFIGNPRGVPQFFREEAWTNAYLELYGIAIRAIGG